MKKLLYIFLLISFIGFAQTANLKLTKYTTDLTNTLTSDEVNSLNSSLKAFDDSTSNQIVVVMIGTLDGNSIEDAAIDLAKNNNVGTKKNNNGVLLLVVKDDRKVRIEVGYGLEGALTDAQSISIINNSIKPEFKNGNYYQGLANGVSDIQKAIKGEYKEPKKKNNATGFKIVIAIIGIILYLMFRNIGGGGGYRYRSSGFRNGMFWGGFGGFSGGSGWGGGSSWGGGGGFSGGGGSFGGGGASGSW